MEFKEVMERRHSCRKYSSEPVNKEMLQALLEAGRLSPSACNSQRWVFLAVDDSELTKKIASTMYNEEVKINWYADQIPAFIAVVQHPVRNPTETQKVLLSKGETDWALVDIGIAAGQICLTATDLCLGSVMIGWFDQAVAKEALGLPDETFIPLFIGVGHPANPDQKKRTPRLSSEEVTGFNSYQNIEETK